MLDAVAWIAARQNIDAIFSKLLPWWWNITLLLLFLAAYLNQGHARLLFFTAGALLLFGMVTTIVIEVPINKQIASWSPGAFPLNWMDLRNRWLAFHNVRSTAAVMAFACALIVMTRR